MLISVSKPTLGPKIVPAAALCSSVPYNVIRVSVGPSMRAFPAIWPMPPSRAYRPRSRSWVSVDVKRMSVASLWISTKMSSGLECRNPNTPPPVPRNPFWPATL